MISAEEFFAQFTFHPLNGSCKTGWSYVAGLRGPAEMQTTSQVFKKFEFSNIHNGKQLTNLVKKTILHFLQHSITNKSLDAIHHPQYISIENTMMVREISGKQGDKNE